MNTTIFRVPAEELFSLRHLAFGWGTSPESTRIDGDSAETSRHYALYEKDENNALSDVLGCASVYRVSLNGRLMLRLCAHAIAPTHRGVGLGKQLLRFVEEDAARALGITSMRCIAPLSVVTFYEKEGWNRISLPFWDDPRGPTIALRRHV